MFKQIVGFILIVVLALTFSHLVLAQDIQKESKKEEKIETTKGDTETGPLKSISCGADCGFMVKSRNEKELISIVKKHLEKMHDKKLSSKEVKQMIKTE
jgi:predicted small metal-binding protein